MAIIGNQKTIKLLDRIAESGKIAGAYLFLGPESVGKFSAALEFANKIIGKGGTINADLIVVAPEIEEIKGVLKKRDIKIEAIRDLQHKLSLTATGGKYKVVIIDEAQRLNKSAQNALLKTLEEPNEQVVLILNCQNADKLLPTIASRCQKINFGLASDVEIAKIIPENNPAKKEIIFWSIGRLGIAFDLLNKPEELSYRNEVLREFKDIFSKNLSEKFSLAEAWSKDTTQAQKKMKLWLIILRQSMLNSEVVMNVSPDKALILIEEISQSLRTMRETNSNARLILENLLLKF